MVSKIQTVCARGFSPAKMTREQALNLSFQPVQPTAMLSGIMSDLRKLSAATLAAIAIVFVPTAVSSNPNVANVSLRSTLVHSCGHTTACRSNNSRPPRTPRVPFATHPVVIFDKDFAIGRQPLWSLESAPQHGRHRERADQNGNLLSTPPSLTVEARILCRLLVALVVGGIIGVERRAANSLAGIRTFSLVSLGAAILMSTSLAAFPSADPTRIAAAISSSVGFLGAGAINKNSKQSRGLTTASSVWLAAALGIASATGMFLLSFSGAIVTVLTARYGRFDSSLHRIRTTRSRDNGNDIVRDSSKNASKITSRDTRLFGEERSSCDGIDSKVEDG